jgi:hypothetical protein
VRGADDFACVVDGSVPDLGVVAHQSLLGSVQAKSRRGVTLDLHDHGPLTIEHPRRCHKKKNEMMAIICDNSRGG